MNIVRTSNNHYLGVIFEAWDSKRKENVALKIEKKDKIKTILLFEFKVLNNLQRKRQLLEI